MSGDAIEAAPVPAASLHKNELCTLRRRARGAITAPALNEASKRAAAVRLRLSPPREASSQRTGKCERRRRTKWRKTTDEDEDE